MVTAIINSDPAVTHFKWFTPQFEASLVLAQEKYPMYELYAPWVLFPSEVLLGGKRYRCPATGFTGKSDAEVKHEQLRINFFDYYKRELDGQPWTRANNRLLGLADVELRKDPSQRTKPLLRVIEAPAFAGGRTPKLAPEAATRMRERLIGAVQKLTPPDSPYRLADPSDPIEVYAPGCAFDDELTKAAEDGTLCARDSGFINYKDGCVRSTNEPLIELTEDGYLRGLLEAGGGDTADFVLCVTKEGIIFGLFMISLHSVTVESMRNPSASVAYTIQTEPDTVATEDPSNILIHLVCATNYDKDYINAFTGMSKEAADAGYSPIIHFFNIVDRFADSLNVGFLRLEALPEVTVSWAKSDDICNRCNRRGNNYTGARDDDEVCNNQRNYGKLESFYGSEKLNFVTRGSANDPSRDAFAGWVDTDGLDFMTKYVGPPNRPIETISKSLTRNTQVVPVNRPPYETRKTHSAIPGALLVKRKDTDQAYVMVKHSAMYEPPGRSLAAPSEFWYEIFLVERTKRPRMCDFAPNRRDRCWARERTGEIYQRVLGGAGRVLTKAEVGLVSKGEFYGIQFEPIDRVALIPTNPLQRRPPQRPSAE